MDTGSVRTHRARVTTKGQLTVPKSVRDALGVGPGDDLVFAVGPQGVMIRPGRTESPFAALAGAWRRGQGARTEHTDAWLRTWRGHDDE